ncbi:MAG: hypothetical protein RLZZ58_1679 [Pseudomonadota bacterium]
MANAAVPAAPHLAPLPPAVPVDAAPVAAATDAGTGWMVDPELFDAAIADIRAKGEIQTAFSKLPEKPPQQDGFLRDFFEWLDRLFAGSGGMFKILIWTLVILFALAVLYRLSPTFADWVGQLRRRAPVVDAEEGLVEAARARELLTEADALAADGRYEEAVHLLLWRSLEDIDRRRPDFVRPALTSREIAAAQTLPAVARGAFAAIARAVEHSLFGGNKLGAADWTACRTAYADLTVARNWAAA